MLLGMALVMGGIQFIAIGLIGELLARTYYESQNKPVYNVRELRGRRSLKADRTQPPRTAGRGDRISCWISQWGHRIRCRNSVPSDLG